MKAGTTELLKFKKLQRMLSLKLWECVGLLEMLWSVTAKNAQAGDIGKYSNEEIAAGIEWERDADELISALVACRWIDEHAEHRLIVHDWHEHAPNYIKGGMSKACKDFASKKNASQGTTQAGSLAISQGTSLGTSQATTQASSHQVKPSLVKSNQAKSSQANAHEASEPDWQQPDGDQPPEANPSKPGDVLTSFPDTLDTEQFSTAWHSEWIPYQRQLDTRGRAPPLQTQQAQLAELARLGSESAIVALRTSIRHGWKGVFPDKVSNTKGKSDGKRRATIITD